MSARNDQYLAEARAAWKAVRDVNRTWRAVFTDSESLDGVALVCTAEGTDDRHTVLDLGSGPQRDEQGVYDCCPWPQFETHSTALAAYLVALLNTDHEKDTAAAATSTPVTVYRAGYDGESIPLGWYTTPEAARAHCEASLSTNYPVHVTLVFDWIGDESEPLDPWELVAEINGGDEEPTGYVVTPIQVASAYDPDAEQ